MTTGHAIHRADDGTETDITEGVQALYDLVINSMDFGSGFWTEDDAAPVAVIGHLLGFAEVDRVDDYIRDRVHATERQQWLREHPEHQPPITGLFTGLGVTMQDLLARAVPVPHDHVLSSVGWCMWPRCGYRDD